MPQIGKNVSYVRTELTNLCKEYDTIRDCLNGQEVIKSKKDKYLPRPNPLDISEENYTRYKDYLNRAVFYGVTNRTLVGLLGQIFHKKATVKLPLYLEELSKNINGAGLNLEQFSKKVCGNIISFGRGGILTDFTNSNENEVPTKESIDNGNIRPVLKFYESSDIINWRTIDIGSNSVLSLVVLKEKYPYYDDGFELKEDVQYRVLRLEEGKYYQYIYRGNVKNAKRISQQFTEISKILILDHNGNPFNEIQFEFIGSSNNDVEIDYPPLYNIAALNIAHYRNSADYEEMCYICGQITPYFTGLTQEWVAEVLRDKVYYGSRTTIPLPVGATAGIIQASSNSVPFEAMGHKEKQMAALGAKLVEPRKVQQTATEDQNDKLTENSMLGTIANNVSLAIENSLKRMLSFVKSDDSDILYKLNTDFEILTMSEGERRQLTSEWKDGIITFNEVRTSLRNIGVAFDDDKEALLLFEEKDRQKNEKENQNPRNND